MAAFDIPWARQCLSSSTCLGSDHRRLRSDEGSAKVQGSTGRSPQSGHDNEPGHFGSAKSGNLQSAPTSVSERVEI